MSRLAYLAAASSAAALLVLPVCSSGAADDEPTVSEHRVLEGTRVKGLRPHLVIHRKRGATIERMQPNGVAHPGDVLQISYVAAGHQHGVVVSIDGAGGVTLHHPPIATSTRLHARGEHPLPTAFELDDAPSFERFILVTTGNTPTDIDLVFNSARRLASNHRDARAEPLVLPAGFTQSTLLLRKTS